MCRLMPWRSPKTRPRSRVSHARTPVGNTASPPATCGLTSYSRRSLAGAEGEQGLLNTPPPCSGQRGGSPGWLSMAGTAAHWPPESSPLPKEQTSPLPARGARLVPCPHCTAACSAPPSMSAANEVNEQAAGAAVNPWALLGATASHRCLAECAAPAGAAPRSPCGACAAPAPAVRRQGCQPQRASWQEQKPSKCEFIAFFVGSTSVLVGHGIGCGGGVCVLGGEGGCYASEGRPAVIGCALCGRYRAVRPATPGPPSCSGVS